MGRSRDAVPSMDINPFKHYIQSKSGSCRAFMNLGATNLSYKMTIIIALILLRGLCHARSDTSPPTRDVTVIVDLNVGRLPCSSAGRGLFEQVVSGSAAFNSNGEMLLPSHAQLHIGPTATDGAVRIQLNFSPAYVYFDMLDYTPAFSRAPGPYPAAGRDRARIPVGDTRLSNNELMDPSAAGDGILKNILNDENGRFRQGYVQGQADCFTLVDELINSPNTYLGHGVRANPLYDHLFDSYEEYNRLRFENDPMQRIIIPDIGLRHRQAMSSNVNHRNVVTDWNNLAGRSPPASPPAGQPPPQHPVSQGEAAAQQLEDARSSSAFPIEVDLSYDLYEDPYSPFESELQSMADESTPELDSPRAMMQEGRVSPFSEPETQWPEYCERSLVPRAGCAGKGGQGPFDMTLARVNGARSMIVMSTQAAAQAAGIAGVALGAAFVILDFVEGNWKGAAIGAAVSIPSILTNSLRCSFMQSLILGTAAVLAADGPIGWLLGGLITAFFAILPKLFGGHKAAQPYNNNITQIIQYQMFGDAKHTWVTQGRQRDNTDSFKW